MLEYLKNYLQRTSIELSELHEAFDDDVTDDSPVWTLTEDVTQTGRDGRQVTGREKNRK